MAKRGRPKKSISSKVVGKFIPQPVKMEDLHFEENLFKPMLTHKKIDHLLSSDRGLMRGCNLAFIGDPGVGKSTVLMDLLSDHNDRGQKCLFISGEMTSIDLFGYVKRFPKFKRLPILFMGEYHDKDPMVILKSILSEGWDIVLIDSMAEIVNSIVDFHGGTFKSAESKLLNLFEDHNKANNKNKVNTTFLIVQQVTKAGHFAGSNRFKHMLTGMFHMEFDREIHGRYIYFSKNRRGGEMNKLYFDLSSGVDVKWLHTAPLNMDI